MKTDIWHQIPGTSGFYEASVEGHIRSTDRTVVHRKSGLLQLKGKLLKKTIGEGGYYYVTICLDGIRKKRYCHELVCETFYGARPVGWHIDHRDKNRLNNRLINLVYKTVHANCSMPGSKHPFAKLSEDQVLEIRRKYVPRVYTMKMLGEEYGVDMTAIGHIIKRKNWKHI